MLSVRQLRFMTQVVLLSAVQLSRPARTLCSTYSESPWHHTTIELATDDMGWANRSPPLAAAAAAALCMQFMTQNNLNRFPYFTTFSLDFSPEAVHMLGQLSSAVILDDEVQKEIKRLVKIASTA